MPPEVKAPVVTLYQLTMTISNGVFKTRNEAFQAEDRGNVYRAIEQGAPNADRIKLCPKIKVGRIQERPAATAGVGTISFSVVYEDASQQTEFRNSMIQALRERIRLYRLQIEQAMSALESVS